MRGRYLPDAMMNITREHDFTRQTLFPGSSTSCCPKKVAPLVSVLVEYREKASITEVGCAGAA